MINAVVKDEGDAEPAAKKMCLAKDSLHNIAVSPSQLPKVVQHDGGARVPDIQFGTYKMKGEECYRSVLAALKAGYRGIDTASIYENETDVGRAIADSGLPRDQIFVQTKLWRSFVGLAKNGKTPKCKAEVGKSLRKLGLKRIDLWLIHWPGPGRHLNYPPVRKGMERPKVTIEANMSKMVPVDWTPQTRLETYSHMAQFVGKEVGALGVCNFSPRQLTQLLDYCKAHNLPRPILVQNECHPMLQAREMRSLCASEGIAFQAYASLGAGALGLTDHPTLKKVAKEVGATEAQVLLRWSLQSGCLVLPKSSKEDRIRTNLEVSSFKLDDNHMEEINALEGGVKGQNTMVGWLREMDPDFY